MQILASCNLEQASEFGQGKLSIPTEEGKSDRVMLNICVEDGDTSVYQKLTGNEKCVTFIGTPADFCPTSMQGKVYNEVTIEELAKTPQVKGITTLVRLGDDFPTSSCNMLTLAMLSSKRDDVRFIGGKILNIPEVRIGRYNVGKEKSSVYDEYYDNFIEVDLSDLDGVQEKVKKVRAKLEKVTKTKVSKRGSRIKKEKKVSKRKESFQKLFSSNEEEEF